MPIDFDTFVNWAENRFDKIQVKGKEVCLNSIFAENDSKFHLWCNPYGGKHERTFGVFHCWKTDRKGSLVSLVMEVDKCDKDTALKTLGISKLRGRPIEEIAEDLDQEQATWDITLLEKNLTLPPHTIRISQAPLYWYNKAKEYLDGRKISLNNLFICTGGKYQGRIMVPYYSPKGNLIYFNGRTITGSELRYRGPEKECGVGKEDVLFFTSFPDRNAKVYLCEGEFDALSLASCGLVGVACGGKNLSDKQATMLSNYRVCLALDTDEAGVTALDRMYQKLVSICLINPSHRISKVQPPEDFKDWNQFLCEHNTKIVCSYIEAKEEELESEIPYGYR